MRNKMNDSMDVLFSNSSPQAGISLFSLASFYDNDTHKEKNAFFF